MAAGVTDEETKIIIFKDKLLLSQCFPVLGALFSALCVLAHLILLTKLQRGNGSRHSAEESEGTERLGKLGKVTQPVSDSGGGLYVLAVAHAASSEGNLSARVIFSDTQTTLQR